jgi:putative nucleotidyltransferase with HDIG domain
MFDQKQAKTVFKNYADRYDTTNTLILHKITHTYRVAQLAERYAGALGMSASDTDLAWFLGLLHDIGRFEQVRRSGTFVDSQSLDHAQLSADILFEDGLIESFPNEGLPKDWRAIAETAIRQHNKLALSDTLDDRTRCFAEILRDADKTDIFRVIAEIPFDERVGSSRGSFQETGEASPEVMDYVYKHRCIPRGIRHSHFEGRISHCCMAFELVFDISKKTVRQEGYLLNLLATTDDKGNLIWTDKETRQLEIVRKEIEKVLGVLEQNGSPTQII